MNFIHERTITATTTTTSTFKAFEWKVREEERGLIYNVTNFKIVP